MDLSALHTYISLCLSIAICHILIALFSQLRHVGMVGMVGSDNATDVPVDVRSLYTGDRNVQTALTNQLITLEFNHL